jgi:hypothetical protein
MKQPHGFKTNRQDGANTAGPYPRAQEKTSAPNHTYMSTQRGHPTHLPGQAPPPSPSAQAPHDLRSSQMGPTQNIKRNAATRPTCRDRREDLLHRLLLLHAQGEPVGGAGGGAGGGRPARTRVAAPAPSCRRRRHRRGRGRSRVGVRRGGRRRQREGRLNAGGGQGPADGPVPVKGRKSKKWKCNLIISSHLISQTPDTAPRPEQGPAAGPVPLKGPHINRCPGPLMGAK